jgi:hypothetical protein
MLLLAEKYCFIAADGSPIQPSLSDEAADAGHPELVSNPLPISCKIFKRKDLRLDPKA